MAQDEFLTTREVAREYGIAQSTLRYWRSKGRGPESFARGGKSVVYRRSKVEEWLQAEEKKSARGGLAHSQPDAS